MTIERDGNGNRYVDAGNIRVTFVEQSSWAENGHGIRIQAYRAGETSALHRGAELHLQSHEDGYRLIAAIAELMAGVSDAP
jgi:hypothetical protein